MIDADDRFGHLEIVDSSFHRGRQDLGQANDRDERDDEENCAQGSRFVVRRRDMFLRRSKS